MVVNARRSWVRASWVAGAAGAALIAAAIGLDVDISNGGGAMILAGLLIGLSGVICAFVFRSDAAKLDALDAGRGCLARWRFSPGEWSKFRALEEVEEASSKKGLAALMTVISLAIGVPFALAEPRSAPYVLGVLALVCAVCWALAVSLPKRRLAPGSETADVEVLVGRDGVYLPGEFHCWTSFGARFTGAHVREGAHPVLELAYRVYNRHGWNTHDVRVPIPDGALAEAAKVCAALRGE